MANAKSNTAAPAVTATKMTPEQRATAVRELMDRLQSGANSAPIGDRVAMFSARQAANVGVFGAAVAAGFVAAGGCAVDSYRITSERLLKERAERYLAHVERMVGN